MSMIVEQFCENAYMSLEGDLSLFPFEMFPEAVTEPSEVLTRHTIRPVQQFVIMPLDARTITLIKHHVLNQDGIRKRVLHIQIEKQGALVFRGYDRFDRDTVCISGDVGLVLLDDLVDRKMVWSYRCPSKDIRH
jgi:hypothetical protein